MINVLLFSSMYPNAELPVLGVFVENRFRRLVETKQVAVTVVAPVPWFPSTSKWFGRYALHARTPRRETRHGIEIFHPRYVVIPNKISLAIEPQLLYLGVRRLVKHLVRERRIDVIDAHGFFPDGAAAVRLARALGLPVCVTGHGTDLMLLSQLACSQSEIERAARHADELITVCDALQRPLINMGIEASKITTLRNGVDLSVFRLLDRNDARARWGASGPTIISVGGLIELKGHHLIVEALKSLRDATLLIAGDGPYRSRLEQQIAAAGLSSRARLLGQVAHEQLPSLYNAADVLVLASSREGGPLVLLEAMACGTPVVATDVGGIGEVVCGPDAGLLIKERTPAAIADGLRTLFGRLPNRASTRAYAERFSWDATAEGQLRLFQRLMVGRKRALA